MFLDPVEHALRSAGSPGGRAPRPRPRRRPLCGRRVAAPSTFQRGRGHGPDSPRPGPVGAPGAVPRRRSGRPGSGGAGVRHLGPGDPHPLSRRGGRLPERPAPPRAAVPGDPRGRVRRGLRPRAGAVLAPLRPVPTTSSASVGAVLFWPNPWPGVYAVTSVSQLVPDYIFPMYLAGMAAFALASGLVSRSPSLPAHRRAWALGLDRPVRRPRGRPRRGVLHRPGREHPEPRHPRSGPSRAECSSPGSSCPRSSSRPRSG